MWQAFLIFLFYAAHASAFLLNHKNRIPLSNLLTNIKETENYNDVPIQAIADWLQISPVKPNDASYRPLIPNMKAWELMPILEQENKLEKSVEDSKPPELIDYIMWDEAIPTFHEEKINQIVQSLNWENRTVTLDKVSEAFKIAYVGLWNLKAERTLEPLIKRVEGSVKVLLDLEEKVSVSDDILLSAILADVIERYIVKNKDDFERVGFRKKLVEKFGEKVISTGEKYSRLEKFMSQRADYSEFQSEMFLQMLVSTVEQYDLLYIRIAERCHTLRTIKKLPLGGADRAKICKEARHVYVPLADKMGLEKIKAEMEDSCFSVLEPTAFAECNRNIRKVITNTFNQLKADMDDVIRSDPFLRSQKVTVQLKNRMKTAYQIYLKMKLQNLGKPSDVKDIIGYRVVLNVPRNDRESDAEYTRRSNEMCYYVHSKVKVLPSWHASASEFKDYIKGTKDNGYQSLHQYLRNKESNVYVEMQIRTEDMHKAATLGDAAHWYYKDCRYRPAIASHKLYSLAWRSPQQTQIDSPAELVILAKNQILAHRNLVYASDKSTILNLEKRCTALDAAFAIHTSIGLSTTGIRVNGRAVPLDYVLKNGDVVQVETTEGKVPCAVMAWLEVAKSTQALDALKRHLNKNAKVMCAVIGCVKLLSTLSMSTSVVTEAFAKEGFSTITADSLTAVLKKTKSPSSVAKFLITLGEATRKEEVAGVVAQAIGVSPAAITSMCEKLSLTWARMQERHGWEDRETRDSLLLPLLDQLLSQEGLGTAREKWCELIGPKSLTDEHSRYFSALSSRMRKRRFDVLSAAAKSIVAVAPVVDADSPIKSPEPNPKKVPVTLPLSMVSTTPAAVKEAAPMQVQVYPRPIAQKRSERMKSDISEFRRAPHIIARTPYCLEASTMPPQFIRNAKQKYAYRALFQEKS